MLVTPGRAAGKGSLKCGVWGPAFLSVAAAARSLSSFHACAVFLLSQGPEDSEDDDDNDLEIVADPQGSLEASGALNSDDDAESCPICLNAFRDQAVGTPQSCAHYFCLDCIVEWSKVRWPLLGFFFLRDGPVVRPLLCSTGSRAQASLGPHCICLLGSRAVGSVRCTRRQGPG